MQRKNGNDCVFGERTRDDFPAKVEYVQRVAGVDGSGVRLLDVGCGKGWFLQEAVRHGFDARGVDLGQAAVDFACRNLGLDVRQGSLPDVMDAVWKDRFDVVTLWATVEHLSDPSCTLNAAFHCLKPGGYLFLDTGLGNRWAEDFLAGHTQWFDAPQHLWVFSRKGLSILLDAAGFHVQRIDSNWERTLLRKHVKAIRFTYLCMSSYIVSRLALGATTFQKMKEETRWPIGTLISIVARKPA